MVEDMVLVRADMVLVPAGTGRHPHLPRAVTVVPIRLQQATVTKVLVVLHHLVLLPAVDMAVAAPVVTALAVAAVMEATMTSTEGQEGRQTPMARPDLATGIALVVGTTITPHACNAASAVLIKVAWVVVVVVWVTEVMVVTEVVVVARAVDWVTGSAPTALITTTPRDRLAVDVEHQKLKRVSKSSSPSLSQVVTVDQETHRESILGTGIALLVTILITHPVQSVACATEPNRETFSSRIDKLSV